MTTVVVISDNEDADDDCVIVDDECESDLFHEVYKENHLLGDFIKQCLKLENSRGMRNVLSRELLKHYHAADKASRESPRFQKNLRRAIYLLKTEPDLRFTHIKDLCIILKRITVKKRVPFVTLSKNVEDKHWRPNEIKRRSTEQLNVINDTWKKAKLCDNHSPFSENNNISFNDSCNDDTMNESMGMESSQQSSEEDKLLVEKRVSSIIPTPTEKKLKVIERKIAYYKQRIAFLDEQEVDDDSVNSAYIKSERLKIKVVSLYKERCQLIGNQPVHHKRIRLKLPEGRPPGPTRVLERFLNMNCNKDGHPHFPDFCDVVTCVTEANEKETLGWTKAQIMNEATSLFTLCGRALQKRRQNREYRDLLYKVKMEEIERDPADDDPQLLAKLEANKRIAVKKETEILERYTTLQYAAPKSKSQTKITSVEVSGDKNTGDSTSKVDGPADITDNNHDTIPSNVADSEDSYDCIILNANDSLNVDKKSTGALRCDANDSSRDNRLMDTDNDNNSTSVLALEHCSGGTRDSNHKTVPNNVIGSAGHVNKPAREDNDSICLSNNHDLEANFNIGKNQMLHVNSIENDLNHKENEDVMSVLNRLGDNYTLTVEILSDSW